MNDPWADLLNPETLRERLTKGGLFILAHEMLRDAIVGRLRDFFTFGFVGDEDLVDQKRYRESVLSRDPKGKGDAFRGSIAWLLDMHVISENDAAEIRELTDERNKLAHELNKFVGGSYHHDFDALFPRLVELVTKIDRWWIMNVEIDTDEELAGRGIDEHDVTPGSLMLLQVITKVALGRDDEAWELYRAYMEMKRPRSGN